MQIDYVIFSFRLRHSLIFTTLFNEIINVEIQSLKGLSHEIEMGYMWNGYIEL
jgi:hypothetical protein